jgi:Zinc knuckle
MADPATPKGDPPPPATPKGDPPPPPPPPPKGDPPLPPYQRPVPQKPKIGTLFPSSSGYEPVVGGKPNRAWTGPDPTKPTLYTASNCRFIDLKESGRQRAARLKFDEPKFKKGDDIYEFGRRMMAHFEEHGIDPVMYTYSPTDPNDMVSVLTNFDELQITDVKSDTKELMDEKWDPYDQHNNNEARSIIISAVDNETATFLHQKDPYNELPAAVLFLHIAKRGQVKLTTDFFAAKRTKFDSLNIKAFAGENVQKYVEIARPLAQDLIKANEWVSMSTILIFKVFVAVSVPMFAFTFSNELDKARIFLDSIRRHDEKKKRELMSARTFDPLDLLDLGEAKYLRMVDEKTWTPAGNVIDKAKAPEINALQAQVNALQLAVQKGNKCFNCGKEGHFIADCKAPKKDETKAGESKGKKPQKRVEKGWRAIKPKPNATVHCQRTQADGTKTNHYFCRTCDRWCKHVAPEDSSKHLGIEVHSSEFRRKKDDAGSTKPEANLVFDESDGVPFFEE